MQYLKTKQNYFHREMPDYIVRLHKYPIPGDLRRQMNISGKLQEVFKTFENAENCTPASHCEKFSKLLHVEELQMEVDIQKYQMGDAKLERDAPFLTLDVPGLAENRPSLVRGDRLFVRKLGANGKPEQKKDYEGYVHKVGLNKVYLKFSAR
jgi:helicase MOV-10